MVKSFFIKNKLLLPIAAVLILAAVFAIRIFAVRGVGIVYVANCFKNTYGQFEDDVNTLAKNLGYKNKIGNLDIETSDLFIDFDGGFEMEDKKTGDGLKKTDLPETETASQAAAEIVDNYEFTKDFFYSLKVSRGGDEYIISNGNKINCKVYTVEVDEKKFMEYIAHIKTKGTRDFLFGRAAAVLNRINSRLELDIPQFAINEFIDYITPENTAVKNNVPGGIKVTVYIHKNKVYKAKTSVSFENMDISSLTVEVNAGDGSGKMLNRCGLYIGAVINGEKLNINLSGKGNAADKTDTVDYNVSANIMYAHIDSFKVSADLSYSGGDIELDGSYSVLMLKQKIGGKAEINSLKDRLEIKYYDADGKNAVTVNSKKG